MVTGLNLVLINNHPLIYYVDEFSYDQLKMCLNSYHCVAFNLSFKYSQILLAVLRLDFNGRQTRIYKKMNTELEVNQTKTPKSKTK